MAAADGAGSDFVRRKTVTAHNDASMRTVANFGEFGRVTLDEPVPHGGTGQGPSPLQAVVGALCGCEAVTFHRTAAERGLRYEFLHFEAAFTIDIRAGKATGRCGRTSRPCGCGPSWPPPARRRRRPR
jgi:OsmC-like protein